MIVLGKQSPAFARVRVRIPDPQRAERNTLRIEHSEDVVIGMQQQLCGIAETGVGGPPRWIRVSMRADDREVLNR
jgi:hypothetical protein